MSVSNTASSHQAAQQNMQHTHHASHSSRLIHHLHIQRCSPHKCLSHCDAAAAVAQFYKQVFSQFNNSVACTSPHRYQALLHAAAARPDVQQQQQQQQQQSEA
jgi:hypothetical protein